MRKIITRCVIDMETLLTIEEDSYLYDGPISECKGGGGGSASGKIGFPAYMETVHKNWLDNAGADTLSFSMTDTIEAAHNNSPWTGITTYDPSTDIAGWETVRNAFGVILSGFNTANIWDGFNTQASSSLDTVLEADITQSISDFSDQLDADIEAKVLPRFRRGMQDINAVVSSAFPIGEAIIESYRDKDVAKYSSDIRLGLMDKKAQLIVASNEQMVRLLSHKLSLDDSYVKNVIESNRIKIVAKTEQIDRNAKYDEVDTLWNINLFQFGGNLLGAAGGGVVKPSQSNPSTAQSVLGGAMSGAAAGASFGPWGAAIGGVVGAASGLL